MARFGWALTAGGWTLISLFVATTAWLGDIASNVRLFQVMYLIGFIGYLILAAAVVRGTARGAWRAWFVGCIVLRAVLLPVQSSDDLYRYLWEGRVQKAGFNPYAYPPESDALTALRDDNWNHINHPDYPAIYPPLAQWLFRAVALISPTRFAFKVVFTVCDILTIYLLGRVLSTTRRKPHLAVLYALSPITLTAFGVEGHLDSLMLACLVAVMLAHAHRRIMLCAVLVAAATLVKTVPVLLLVWLVVQDWRAAVLGALLVIVGYLPFADAGEALFQSLIRFAGTTEQLGLVDTFTAYLVNSHFARWVGGSMIAVISVLYAARRQTLERYLYATMATTIICMPVVHYWYATWPLISLPFRIRAHWLVLTATFVFYFHAKQLELATGTWQLPAWTPYAIYTPFVITWLIEWMASRRRSL